MVTQLKELLSKRRLDNMAESRKVTGTAADFSRNMVIAEKNVVARIKDWNDVESEKETIKVQFEILSGTKKGVDKIYDNITWDKDNKFNWKYGRIRKAINMPIPKNVIDEFDLIELVGKLVLIDLVPSKDGRYQNIQYKDYYEETINKILADEKEIEENSLPLKTEETNQSQEDELYETSNQLENEDDLPF